MTKCQNVCNKRIQENTQLLSRLLQINGFLGPLRINYHFQTHNSSLKSFAPHITGLWFTHVKLAGEFSTALRMQDHNQILADLKCDIFVQKLEGLYLRHDLYDQHAK